MNGSFYDFVLSPFEAFALRRLRHELLSHAHGQTLEVGIGTGLNFEHYPKDAVVLGIEPDPSMRSVAEKRAGENLKISEGDAQNLDFPDESFDTVVATLVFCTIPDPARAIAEVYRVLKPGGSFLLLEHIRKNTPVTGWILDHLTPLWKHVAGGCHLNRDPSIYLQQAGFKTESLQTLWRGLGKVWYLRK